MFRTLSDDTLVAKALDGQADAWDKLIGRYERKIFNFALRLTGNREDAMDLMQEVFMAVYRNLGGFGMRSSFASWLYSIASKRAIDFYRRKKATEPFQEEGIAAALEDSPFHNLARQQTNTHVLALLANLPPEQRLVVELKFFQDQTFDEMAETLGVSANTLKSRLYSALKRIKTMPEVAHATG